MEKDAEAREEASVLVVDDEEAILRLYRIALDGEDLHLVTAQRGEEALRWVSEHRLDLILLDQILPDMSGLDLLTQLRRCTDAPVLMVTADANERIFKEALVRGAQDVISKPFLPDDLVASVRLLLGRSSLSEASAKVLVGANVELDLGRRRVTRDGQELQLSRTEWSLLRELARNPRGARLDQELLVKVWGPEYRNDRDYLHIWIERIEAKLGSGVISRFENIGYILTPGEKL